MSMTAHIVETRLRLHATSNTLGRNTVLLATCGLRLATRNSETYVFSYIN